MIVPCRLADTLRLVLYLGTAFRLSVDIECAKAPWREHERHVIDGLLYLHIEGRN